MKHVVSTSSMKLTCTAVDRDVYVTIDELDPAGTDTAFCRTVLFRLLPGEVEAVLCALADARRDSQLRDRGV